MSKNREGTGSPREWRFGERPERFYALADTARLLGRSRPTLMRWLASLEEATGHAPWKDPSGRWFIPVAAVERLRQEPRALQHLVESAAKSRGESLRTLREQLAHCRAELAQLKGSLQRREGEHSGPANDRPHSES